MATISFDEKVIITDSQTIISMQKDLEDTTPVEHKINDNFTIEKAEENGRI